MQYRDRILGRLNHRKRHNGTKQSRIIFEMIAKMTFFEVQNNISCCSKLPGCISNYGTYTSIYTYTQINQHLTIYVIFIVQTEIAQHLPKRLPQYPVIPKNSEVPHPMSCGKKMDWWIRGDSSGIFWGDGRGFLVIAIIFFFTKWFLRQI